MKKPSKPKTDDDLRPHYDFSKGVRGKHFERYWEGKGVVLLEPDIAKVFKNSAAVNAALRGLIEIADKVSLRGKRSGAA